MVILTTDRSNGYSSGNAATQPFAVPNTDVRTCVDNNQKWTLLQ